MTLSERINGLLNYKGVDYISLVPILTKAILEQQEMIELLNQRILDLEGR